jgi:hypothetical protein
MLDPPEESPKRYARGIWRELRFRPERAMIWSDKYTVLWYETPSTIEPEIEGKTSSETAIFRNPGVESCSGEEKGGMLRFEDPGSCRKRDSATQRRKIHSTFFLIMGNPASLPYTSRFSGVHPDFYPANQQFNQVHVFW